MTDIAARLTRAQIEDMRRHYDPGLGQTMTPVFCKALCDLALAALLHEAGELKAGFVLVPLVPTDKMVWSLCEMADKCHRCEKGVWDCDNLPQQCGNYEFAREYCEEMIAAAQETNPSPPERQGQGAEAPQSLQAHTREWQRGFAAGIEAAAKLAADERFVYSTKEWQVRCDVADAIRNLELTDV